MSEPTMRLIMWIIILILANSVYSLWKKDMLSTFVVRTLMFITIMLIAWFIF